ncbi:MAG: hypothetical protein JWO70_1658 [Betaproteobacteria bacterium]|jgi:hypothetical protein|nr:hypothetical protein [Betaproteobacteria bacterium]
MVSPTHQYPIYGRKWFSHDAVIRRARSVAACFGLAVTLAFALPASAQTAPPDKSGTPRQGGSGTLQGAIELCDRLAGTERELCVQQARENRERAGAAIGATPGDADVTRRGGAADNNTGSADSNPAKR